MLRCQIHIILILVGFSLLLPSISFSTTNTLATMNGLTLRLVPKNPEDVSGLGAKTITVSASDTYVEVKWSSQVRSETTSEPWPVYKIMMKRGGIRTSNIDETQHMSHPHLWAPGYFNLSSSSILWVPPQIIIDATKRKKETYSLEPGLFSPSSSYFEGAPPTLLEKLVEFRQLVEIIKKENPQETNQKIMTDKEKKECRQFLADFSTVQILTANKIQPVIVNGEKEKATVLVLGNKFIEYTVLRYPGNPLILSIDFIESRVPLKLKPYFSYFNDYLEYQITQIQTEQLFSPR